MSGYGIILEYAQIGRSVEVRAVDVRDGLEVSFIAPVGTPDKEIELIAGRKLDWVRRKKRNARKALVQGDQPHRDKRGGIIV